MNFLKYLWLVLYFGLVCMQRCERLFFHKFLSFFFGNLYVLICSYLEWVVIDYFIYICKLIFIVYKSLMTSSMKICIFYFCLVYFYFPFLKVKDLSVLFFILLLDPFLRNLTIFNLIYAIYLFIYLIYAVYYFFYIYVLFSLLLFRWDIHCIFFCLVI